MSRLLRAGTALLLCVGLLLPLSGCGALELYQRLLIHGIGVDRAGDDLVLTVRSSAGEGREEAFSCRGATVADALVQLTRSTGRRPFLAHNYLVVLGRACAEHGLTPDLDFFIRRSGTRPAVELYLARDTAGAVLCAQKDGAFLKMSQLQELSSAAQEIGLGEAVDLLGFENALLTPGRDPVLPVAAVQEGEVVLDGMGFFRGDVLAGFLPAEALRGLLAAQNRLSGGEAVVPGAAGGSATLALTRCMSRLDPDPADPLRFDLRVELLADVAAYPTGERALDEAAYAFLEQGLSAELEGQIRSILRAAGEAGCDVLGLGSTVYRRAPQAWRDLEDRWPQLLPQCAVSVTVSVEVRRIRQEVRYSAR